MKIPLLSAKTGARKIQRFHKNVTERIIMYIFLGLICTNQVNFYVKINF